MLAPMQTHSGLELVISNTYGEKDGALGDWYFERFGHRMHKGIDLVLSGKPYQTYGTPLISIVDGYVPFVGNYGEFGGRGNFILVQSEDRSIETLHAHASKVFVKSGQFVRKGQIIGTCGNTGAVYPEPTLTRQFLGTHLHFEVRVPENGIYVAVDPMPYLDLDNAPVAPDTGLEYDVAPLSWAVQNIAVKVRELEAQFAALNA